MFPRADRRLKQRLILGIELTCIINIILLFGPWWSNSIIVILILKEQIEKEFPPAGYETGTFDTATQRAHHSTMVITATK